MAKIYHGCMTKNANGTIRLNDLGEKCLVLTAKCIWEDPEDIKGCEVKT